jgi:hypothetical protein
MTYKKVDLALFIWYAIAVVFGNVMNLRVRASSILHKNQGFLHVPMGINGVEVSRQGANSRF